MATASRPLDRDGNRPPTGRVFHLLPREASRVAGPNAGWPMAAAAFALGVRLHMPGAYTLNAAGARPEADDIDAAASLIRRAAWLGIGLVVGARPGPCPRSPRPRFGRRLPRTPSPDSRTASSASLRGAGPCLRRSPGAGGGRAPPPPVSSLRRSPMRPPPPTPSGSGASACVTRPPSGSPDTFGSRFGGAPRRSASSLRSTRSQPRRRSPHTQPQEDPRDPR